MYSMKWLFFQDKHTCICTQTKITNISFITDIVWLWHTDKLGVNDHVMFTTDQFVIWLNAIVHSLAANSRKDLMQFNKQFKSKSTQILFRYKQDVKEAIFLSIIAIAQHSVWSL